MTHPPLPDAKILFSSVDLSDTWEQPARVLSYLVRTLFTFAECGKVTQFVPGQRYCPNPTTKEKFVLRTTRLVNNTSVERLVQLWAKRYVPNLSALFQQENQLSVSQLVEATSKEGRATTAAKLQRQMQLQCECAGIKTDMLFSYIPNIVNLSETQRLARFVWQVYGKALELYQQQPSLSTSMTAVPRSLLDATELSDDVLLEWAKPALELPAIAQLATTLEPVLGQLREQHRLTSDRRTLGFMSTQFHFSTELVLQRLTPVEQVLLSPYFKFIEEQVCIPIQRACYAAAAHQPDSPNLAVVEQLLPQSYDIAATVYNRAARLYPSHHSRRGRLEHPRVMASTIRDLEMLQVYLWLCVLEKDMAAIEKELLPLCVMVFPSVEVTWELIERVLEMLIDELMTRVQPIRKPLLQPYTQTMQQLFANG